MALATALGALRHPRFRVYFFAQGISILGGFVQQVALAWLIYRLTGSSALLGITAFCTLAPQLFIGPLAGAWIDRHDKRHLLLLVESLMAAQALGLALLTWAGLITPPLIVAMALLQGVLNAVDLPTRQSLLLNLVGGRAHLASAIALNAATFNIGRLVGPPLGGLLIGVSSEAWCFALNGVSYLVLIGSIGLMRLDAGPATRSSVGGALREGLRYMTGNFAFRSLLLHVAVLNTTAMSYVVLMPLFAKAVYGGNAVTLGLLLGAAGGGALVASLFLGSLHSPARAAAFVSRISVLTALVMAGIALTRHAGLALPLLALLGFGISIGNVGTNSVLQGIAPDAMRGRVVAVFAGIRFGFDALGGLAAGFAAARFGAPTTLLGSAVLLGIAALFLFRRSARLCTDVERQHRELTQP